MIKGGEGFFDEFAKRVKVAVHGPIPREVSEVLFPHLSTWKCEIGDIHPGVVGAHPDNWYTGEGILRVIGQKPVEGNTFLNWTGSLLAIGSPTSDAIARQIFGISNVSAWPPPNPFDLPVLYDHHDWSQPETLRWLGGKEHRSRRRGIRILTETHSRLVAIDPADNRQLDDYLLVTVLPNYYDESSARSGHRIWHIGGVHGPGTRAFLNIFLDKDLTYSFAERVSVTSFFQALFHVPKVEHNDGVKESYPAGVPQLLRFISLDRDALLSRAAHVKAHLGLGTKSRTN